MESGGESRDRYYLVKGRHKPAREGIALMRWRAPLEQVIKWSTEWDDDLDVAEVSHEEYHNLARDTLAAGFGCRSLDIGDRVGTALFFTLDVLAAGATGTGSP